LPDDDEVGNAGNGIVSPLLAIGSTEGGKETEENHDNVSEDGDEDAGSVHAGEEGKVEQEQWCSQTPVDVTGPEDLTVDVLHQVLLGHGVGDVGI